MGNGSEGVSSIWDETQDRLKWRWRRSFWRGATGQSPGGHTTCPSPSRAPPDIYSWNDVEPFNTQMQSQPFIVPLPTYDSGTWVPSFLIQHVDQSEGRTVGRNLFLFWHACGPLPTLSLSHPLNIFSFAFLFYFFIFSLWHQPEDSSTWRHRRIRDSCLILISHRWRLANKKTQISISFLSQKAIRGFSFQILFIWNFYYETCLPHSMILLGRLATLYLSDTFF